MPIRRVQPSATSNNLSIQPQPTPSGTKPSPSLPSFTRSASPSGLSTFFSKPTKWFSRSPTQRQVVQEPRSSTSSSPAQRRPTISGPTDPRLIIPPPPNDKDNQLRGGISSPGSRSVHDLSRNRASSEFNLPLDPAPGSLGDLRAISRKAWSKSADNLSASPRTPLAPLDTSFGADQRVRIEQYRSRGTSPATPHSAHTHFPFPTITAPPAPAPASPDLDAPPPRHARSASHTSSAAPAPAPAPAARLAPPSPEQHHAPFRMRSGEFERERARDRDRASGSAQALLAFSSYFNAAGTGGAKPGTPPPAPAPALVVDLTPPVDEDAPAASRRASQIVHRAGLVNRLHAFSPAAPQLAARHWKPCKLVLRGSKLCFYKPPAGRAAAIAALFPAGLVAVHEDTHETDVETEGDGEDVGVKNKEREREEGRKRRAFWGRGPHPALVAADGVVEKGSFEALVHEAVFGTTFRTTSLDEENEDWRGFAGAVLLCLPHAGGRAKFEAEFCRCTRVLVNGAREEEQAAARARAAWLAAEYVALHGEPADAATWDAFRAETLSPADEDAPLSPVAGSPDVDAFSPRPSDADKLPSFASALAPAGTPSPARTFPTPSPALSPMRSPRGGAGPRTRLWAAVAQEGLSREVFLRLDVDAVVQSLFVHHRALLAAGAPFCAAALLGPADAAPLAAFFGSAARPHWLTRLVVAQVLSPGGGGGGIRDSSDERAAASRTHVRSDVLGRWARTAERARRAGDEAAWRAVAAALCARPVARLEKAWKRVDPAAVAAVRAWVAPPAGATGTACAAEPRAAPWGGDARERAAGLLAQVQVQDGEWIVRPMLAVREIYDEMRRSFAACTKQHGHNDFCDEDEVACLVQLWQDSSKAAEGKVPSIDQYMSLSFAAEPRRKGRFAPHYWTRPAGSQGLQALIPLAFLEPLPVVALIDRSQIVRSKKVSLDAGGAMNDAQIGRIAQLKFSLEPEGLLSAVGAAPGREFGGTVLRAFDGELLLLVQRGAEPASRPTSAVDTADAPPSRAPSIRVKSAAAHLERKTSRARRSSMPALSQRPALAAAARGADAEPPLRVVVQAGTLDALVDLLVHDLTGVGVAGADDNGEMALRDGNTRGVRVNRAEFAVVWWHVFRSFVSPLVLFDLLRKRFLAKAAARASLSALDVIQAVRLRLDVLETMSGWIETGGGAQDALDDPELYTAMHAFLASPADHAVPAAVAQNDELAVSWEALENARKTLLEAFVAQTLRPQTRSVPVRGSAGGGTGHIFGLSPPPLDDLQPEELVNNLDALAGASFRNIVQEDLFITADILEVQTADRAGWLLPRECSAASDEVEIQSLYSHIMEVEPTSLIGDLTSDTLYRLLPPGIRSVIRAHLIVQKWAVSKLAAPGLGLKARQARMELFLQAIEVCRLRSAAAHSAGGGGGSVGVADRPCLRSFVESVLTSAVLSAHSRLFYRAWAGVAAARRASVESLASLLAKPAVREVHCGDRLTVDPAWLLERMLEIISLPDVLDSSEENILSLINFEKRRHLFNLVTNASLYTAPRGGQQRREMDRCDFERLNNIEREVTDFNFDLRAVKEEAQRDATAFGPSSTPNNKRALRPFPRLVAAQQEKIKRDKYLRERIIKERRLEQQKQDRREDDLNRAMDARKANYAAHKQHKSKRSMSAFFRVIRPISTAFSSDSIAASSPKRKPADLDFTPTQKPALVLSLVDARVAAFINNERSFTFQLDTEDGGHYLLQAPSKSDMNKWIAAIHNTVHTYAQRRLTYLGDSPKPQLSEHIHTRPKTASRDPTAVFGVNLEFLLRREAGEADVQPGAIPRVMDLCLTEIESRGLTEVGIYRIAGATTEVTALREALNSGKMTIDHSTDIHAVCDVVKYWLRTLPEPVFPESFYHPILDATSVPDLEDRLRRIREVVHSLPRGHYYMLKRLVEHLDRVADFEDKNHMTAQSLSIVFSPNLLRAPHNNFGVIMKNMGTTHVLIKALVTHFHVIFDDADGDAENDDDDDEGGDGDGDEGMGGFDEHMAAEDDEDGDDLSPDPVSPSAGDDLTQDFLSSLTLKDH